MMRRIEPQGAYETASSLEDESSEPNRDGDYENPEDDEHEDEFGGAYYGDEANSLLESPSTETDGSGTSLREAAPRCNSRARCGDGARPPRGPSSRLRGAKCRLLGILAAVAVTVSWVWSSGEGASNLLLRLRDAASQPKPSASPDELIKTPCPAANPDDELLTTPRPYLHELIGDFQSNVIGNVSWLMDFAIVGHAKCSTSAHLYWLRSHPEILMPGHEVHALNRGQPAEMVSLLYTLPNTPRRKRGYKSPSDIMYPHALDSLRTYWPDVKLIVGVRHPVKWFESYYNFRKRLAAGGKSKAGLRLGPAESLRVPALAYFHAHLSLLGKTNVTDPGERALLGDRASSRPPVPMNNKVFLYESTQPYDLHDGNNEQYRRDLQSFLGLTEPLSPITLHGETDGDSYNYTSPNFHYDIDICEDKYAELRRKLVEVGTAAAEWILTYFVPHPEVTVSSPGRFEELLSSWSLDPCEASRRR